MNSKTDDYTGMNRPSHEKDLRFKYFSSSVKKRPFLPLPRRTFNLAPLNLNEIKKELEEADNSGDSKDKNKSTRETKDARDGVENIFKDISNHSTTQERQEAESEVDNELDENDSINIKCTKPKIDLEKENKAVSSTKPPDNSFGSTPANVVSTKVQYNDSFDLDLSASSLQTPVKREQPCMIPKVCGGAQVTKSNKYKTLNVNAELQFTVPKNQFQTPVNPIRNITAITTTPYSTNKKSVSDTITKNIVCSIPKTIPKDETFNKILVNNMEYLILNLLGKGGSSEVYQCYCLDNKLLVAIKCVSLHDEASAVGYINEVKLLKQLQSCDKIIKMYDFEIVDSQKKLYMVLERGGDDLSTILKKLSSQSSHLPVYTLMFYWMNMLHAVQQIHSHGVIHSDLKPANFINTDEGLKLIDFGIASSVQNDETSVIKTRSEGSCNYISPEALNCDSSDATRPNSSEGKYKVHFKSDVWSLGCILYQLVYRKTPFHQFNKLWSKLAYILNPNHKIEYPEANWVPPRLLDTIKNCLQYSVKARPSVKQLIGEHEDMLYRV